MASSAGRVQCLLVASKDGYVIYERFYDNFSDIQKAEIRASFDDTLHGFEVKDRQELVGRFKNGRIVGLIVGAVTIFGLGTGDYDELALLEVIEAIVTALGDFLKTTQFTEQILFEHYLSMVHVIDEVCKDGIIELVDSENIQKSMHLKIPLYTTDSPSAGSSTKIKGLMKRLSIKESKQHAG